jgi:hypothetical protein
LADACLGLGAVPNFCQIAGGAGASDFPLRSMSPSKPSTIAPQPETRSRSCRTIGTGVENGVPFSRSGIYSWMHGCGLWHRCPGWEAMPLALRPSTIPQRLWDLRCEIAIRPFAIFFQKMTFRSAIWHAKATVAFSFGCGRENRGPPTCDYFQKTENDLTRAARNSLAALTRLRRPRIILSYVESIGVNF